MVRKAQIQRHRVPFAFGRLAPATAEIKMVDNRESSAIPGPWCLQALVRPGKTVRFADA